MEKMPDLPKPVKEGDKIRVKIIGKGKKGDYVAKYEGFVIFVNGDVNIGDDVDVVIKEVRLTNASAELV